jgi:hypothetical protein
MYKMTSSPKQLARKIQQAATFLSVAFLLATAAQTVSASCTYTIDSEWPSGFTASITIKNDTGAPINNWNVNWQYSTNRMSNGWNANFSGSNPYSATNMSWNGNIAVGQSISFGVQGEKNGGSAERPTVNGSACGGTTTPASSSRSSSSVAVVSSSKMSSSSSVASSAATNACPSRVENAYQMLVPRIPASIQAEDFDPAGYSDSTSANEGGAYRTDTGVDIKSITNGNAVGWMTAGEWLEYTVYAETEGDYDVTIRSGAVGAGRTFKITQCNTTLIESFQVPNVNNWGEFKTYAAGKVRLKPGYQKIRVTVGATDYADLELIHPPHRQIPLARYPAKVVVKHARCKTVGLIST